MRRKQSDQSVREQRLAIQREIAKLMEEQRRWWKEYVLPAAVAARSIRPTSKFSGKSSIEVPALSLVDADRLGDEDPTHRFEKGRAHVEDLSRRIRSLRTQESKLASIASAAPANLRIDWTGRLDRYIKKILEQTS